MKRLLIILYVLLLLSITYGQDISVSKDTLNCFMETFSDSVYIFNTGNDTLSIDSMKNFNHIFYYTFTYSYKDSIRIEGSFDIFGEEYPYLNIFPLEIPPNDSAKFIFNLIGPVFKRTLFEEISTDSLFIYNNSQNQTVLRINILTDYPTTNIDSEPTIPTIYELQQNYPNPFNPTTKIIYSVPKADHISLKVFDALGRIIKTLVEGYMPVGRYEVIFNSENLSSGVYYYQLITKENIYTRKMLLLR